MPDDGKEHILEILSIAARTTAKIVDVAEAIRRAMEDERREVGEDDHAGQHRPHTRCDFRVFQFVRDAKSPPTRQEVVTAVADGADNSPSESTVEKSVARLAREGHINARPRPLNGYVAVSPPEDE